MRWNRMLARCCGPLLAVALSAWPGGAGAVEQPPLPLDAAGGYVCYHSTAYPYYRLSPHRCTVTDASGEAHGGRIPAIFVLFDLQAYGGKDWTPEPAEDWTAAAPGNYWLAYGCDLAADAHAGTAYRRRRLEDAAFPDPDSAGRIRAILQNAYPFVRAEDMLSALVGAGVLEERDGIISAPENFREDVAGETMGQSELLTAIQAAVWTCANGKTDDPKLRAAYSQSAAVGLFERTLHPDAHDGDAAALIRVENNIRAVYTHLLSLRAKKAGEAEQLVTDIRLAAVRADGEAEGGAAMTVRFRLNGAVRAEDALILRVGENRYALSHGDGSLPVLLPDADGCYTLLLSGMGADDAVTLELCGTQTLGRGVYLYEPQGGRSAAQCMAGVYEGAMPVYLQKRISLSALRQRARLRVVTTLTENDVPMPLAGAVFSLYLRAADGAAVRIAEGLESDAQGLVEAQGLLQPGEGERYVFRQTAAPAGYLPSADEETEAGAAATVRLVNEPAADGAARLTLSDGDDPERGLAGVDFSLFRRLPGSTALFLGDYRTGPDGVIEVGGLSPGNYWFSQLSPPEGYVMEERETYALTIGPEGGLASVAAQNRMHLTLQGTVRFSEDGPPPAGVTVLLLRDGTPLLEQRVSADTDWTYRFENLPIYRADGARCEYRIQQAALPGYAAEYREEGVRNSVRTAELVLLHQDGEGGDLPGAVFALRSAADGTHITTTAATADGALRFYGLRTGSYLLAERRAPAGYRRLEGELVVTVTDPNTAADGTAPLRVTVARTDGTPLPENRIVRERAIPLASVLAGGFLLTAIPAALWFLRRRRARAASASTKQV